MWPFNKRPAPEPCFQIGPYQIDMKIEGMEDSPRYQGRSLKRSDQQSSFEGRRFFMLQLLNLWGLSGKPSSEL